MDRSPSWRHVVESFAGEECDHVGYRCGESPCKCGCEDCLAEMQGRHETALEAGDYGYGYGSVMW